MDNLENKLEALLFVKTEPISLKKAAAIMEVPEEEIKNAILRLEENLSGRGIRLIRKDDEIMLGTAPEAGNLLEKIFKDELERDLGRAGTETVSVILYGGPITKSKIDFIRGVNSQFILRNLMIRGLIDRVQMPKERGMSYRPTMDLLRFLGVTKVEELPDYLSIREKLSSSAEDKTPPSEEGVTVPEEEAQ